MKGILVLITSMPLIAALTPTGGSQTWRLVQTERDLSGVYSCEGERLDGAVYRGIVEIARLEQTYRVRWLFPPSEQHLGLGVVAGDVLAVSYFGSLPGVVASGGPSNRERPVIQLRRNRSID